MILHLFGLLLIVNLVFSSEGGTIIVVKINIKTLNFTIHGLYMLNLNKVENIYLMVNCLEFIRTNCIPLNNFSL